MPIDRLQAYQLKISDGPFAFHYAEQQRGCLFTHFERGLADYGNYYYGATTHAWRIDSCRHTPRSGVYWYSGYQHTAKFLMWLDTQFPGFTNSLVKASLQGTYKKGTYFIEKTNKTPEQLWAVYTIDTLHQKTGSLDN